MLSKILKHFFCIIFSCLLTIILAPIFIYFYRYSHNSEWPNFFNYYTDSLMILGILSTVIVIPYAVISTAISIYLSRFEFYQNKKLVLLAGPFGLLIIGFIYLTLFIYSNTYALLTPYKWKGKILQTQFYNSEDKKLLSESLCNHLKDSWSPSGDDFDSIVKEVHKLGIETGDLAREKHYIQRGYIAYYFEPQNSETNLEDAKEQTINAFLKHGIGPTFYWLNADWHKENKTNYGNRLIDIENSYIRVRFETLFPLLDEYIALGILQNPPPHILKAASDAQLNFIKSERLDPISYTYSLNLNRGYYNVNFILWGVRDKGGGKAFKKLMLNNITCAYPYFDFKSNRPGIAPSPKAYYPKFPIEIPSCFEFGNWLNCQETGKGKGCAALKGTPAPQCPSKDIIFSPEEY